MTNHKLLTSAYVRAWCAEWALNKDATERVLGYYAEIEDSRDVIRFMSAMANAQRFRLNGMGKLVSLEDFMEDPSILPADFDIDWNANDDRLVKRLFS